MSARAAVVLALLTPLALWSCQDSDPHPTHRARPAPTASSSQAKKTTSPDGTIWNGPYRYENLQIWLAEPAAGKVAEPELPFVTLADAIDGKLVRVTEVGAEAEAAQAAAASPVEDPGRQARSDGPEVGPPAPVHENDQIDVNRLTDNTLSTTATVNTLKIQNLGDKPIFVQQGDIVKGGQQDRVIGADFVVPPRSKPMDIAAFCVEHGRWSQRATLASGAFGFSSFGNSATMNSRFISSNSLKVALKSRDQGAVWSSVEKLKGDLVRNIEEPVQLAATSSPSSLVLMNESPTVQEGIKSYVDALGKVMEKHPHACGMAVAINGRMNSIDIYPRRGLFQGHGSKLLHSAATEAISIADCESKAMGSVDPGSLLSRARAEDGKTDKDGNVEHHTWETEAAFLTETRHEGRLIHVNWVARLAPLVPAEQR